MDGLRYLILIIYKSINSFYISKFVEKHKNVGANGCLPLPNSYIFSQKIYC
jgi:hypothetical protein